MYEKKYCCDLQNSQLIFLKMVVIYQKTDELYTLDGYLSKWNIQCYPNLPVPLSGVTKAEPPSVDLEETQSVAAHAVSSSTAVAGPPATARPMREFAEQPDVEMWKDDSGRAWWPGVHKYRQNLPMSAPLLTGDKQFICPTACPSIQTEDPMPTAARTPEVGSGSHQTPIPMQPTAAVLASWPQGKVRVA